MPLGSSLPHKPAIFAVSTEGCQHSIQNRDVDSSASWKAEAIVLNEEKFGPLGLVAATRRGSGPKGPRKNAGCRADLPSNFGIDYRWEGTRVPST